MQAGELVARVCFNRLSHRHGIAIVPISRVHLLGSLGAVRGGANILILIGTGC